MDFLTERPWPDWVDHFAIWWFVCIALALPLVGYWLMVMDIRAYYRALRCALVKVVYHFPQMPAWARYHTPGCLRALGLRWPCSEEDLRTAYRRLAEQVHPDRGGDPREFLKLQRQFEAAMSFFDEQRNVWPKHH
jgi:hypothetical protein